MHRTFSLRLLLLLMASLFTFGTFTVASQEAGVQIRGPKSTDTSPIKQYGPITNADTLWKVALMVRPDPRFSVYQVMQALYLKNPQAFKENNLNHLVNGQYLKVPSYDEIAAIDPVQAQAKSDSDDTIWEKKVKSKPKVAANKSVPANVVQKKDLEQAKTEINQQLEDIGKNQEQRLETIQNDVLDSIDGLQAILQENENLKNRLTKLDEQLNNMQQDVANVEETNAQSDSDIKKTLQELLDKENAREQELLLEKEKAALEANSFTSSLWFTILVSVVPASLLVGLIAFFLMRRKKSEPATEPEEKAPVAEQTPEVAVPETPTDDLSLDGELSLDDELAIDLTEDDDLSELDDSELGGDELFSDDLDDLDDELLDDDVIHLDDDLDDLEDISLDDLGDEPLDDNTQLADDDLDDILDQTADDEGEPLDGGELGQDMLDDLLSGIETDSTPEETPTNSDDDIDALLNEVDDVVEGRVQPEASEEVADPDDIDALLNEVAEETQPAASEEVADPDDIDALLNEVAEEPQPAANEEVADPDDIDALINEVAEEPQPAASEEVADPDDIDALLNEVAEETQPAASEEVADPDDIDALLNEVAEEPQPAASEEVA
ncbi:FimV/HubP family polar landmark protein, partial [Thalassotalea loyana]|uniref:FimV/HubP family polar landmark protein n=1 Tax=Thalassotalea loyana TaxID=280483 RepID=UPI0024E0B561